MAKFKGNTSEDGNADETDVQNLLPVIDDVTKWSSYYNMLESVLKIREALDHVARIDHDLKALEMSNNEWILIEEFFDFLQPFATITKLIEGTKYPTLSYVVPLYNKLMDLVEDWERNKKKSNETREGAKAALAKLSKYYNETTPIYLVCTVLDPRLKLDYFVENGWEEGDDESNGANLLETNVKPA